ncbi:class I SAM-dependent methyltransferase [Desulfopila sp. IMCC35008]|uniref:class I SAM-dependent methyltransferase n=1 Tax=Desulfopila sp. IMCC35008 TaxID=2653858 RepID=UPI0013D3B817|nr:class I SAM-dependent methyltransferase [Desulfopila sp. IMCC35008]
MNDKKFDPKKLKKLNNPQRLVDIPVTFIADKLNMKKPEVFVEIGAGTAFFCIAFLDHFKPEKIYACDISTVMLTWIRENVTPHYPEIIPVQTTENSVPLDDNTADLVFMINLHHELDDPSRSLTESYRLLKPGGKICILDWKKEEMTEGPPEKIRCHPEHVNEQLDKSGFKIIQISKELPKHFLVVGEKH